MTDKETTSSSPEIKALLARLPLVRGRINTDVPLASLTWFRVGGAAQILFKPADLDDLQNFLRACPKEIGVFPLGVASNLLVRDGGIDGVVVRLVGPFAEITVQDDTLHVGAGALDSSIALAAQQAGLGGLEFLIGIPGTFGGGIRTNAGCYGREIKDVVKQVRALDRAGILHVLTPDAMHLSYRHCALPEDWIFVDAILQGIRETPEAVLEKLNAIRAQREGSSQGAVLRKRTGGSTFANPGGAKPTGLSPDQSRAWELIDRAGCRGKSKGGAQFSTEHANFMINNGDATAADFEDLGEEVRQIVKEKTGVTLQWEIQRVGKRRNDPTDTL